MAKKPTDRALVPPRMTILSDHPILRQDEEKPRREPDSFTLHSRFGAVYDVIRYKNTRAPLAIAVYRDWGTRKSSMLKQGKLPMEGIRGRKTHRQYDGARNWPRCRLYGRVLLVAA